jgi:uncharacterized protein (TIRG00374 family)
MNNIFSNYRLESNSSIYRKLSLGVLWGLLALTAVTFGTDVAKIIAILTSFQWEMALPVIFLLLMVYSGRFAKWQIYLKLLDVTVGFRDSLRIFLAGLSLTVTPGKSGEVLKAYLLKRQHNVDFSRSAPTLIAERLSGLIAVIILAGLSVHLTDLPIPYAQNLINTGIVVIGLLILLLRNRMLFKKIVGYLENIPILAPKIDLLLTFYNGAYILNQRTVLTKCVLLSLVSWLAECVILYIILYGLGVKVFLIKIIGIYAIAMIAGGLSMLPGGLGVAEISMVALLGAIGLDHNTSVVATLLVRFVTLWVGVVLGTTLLLKNWTVFKL